MSTRSAWLVSKERILPQALCTTGRPTRKHEAAASAATSPSFHFSSLLSRRFSVRVSVAKPLSEGMALRTVENFVKSLGYTLPDYINPK